MTAPNEKIVALEKPVYGGDCLGRLTGAVDARAVDAGAVDAGKAIFVPLTLPGETVAAHLVQQRRTVAKAEVSRILTPSADRVVPVCAYFGACGGCSYQHAAYPAQLDIKREILRETLVRAGVRAPKEIALLAGEPWGYRNRIRLAVAANGRVGYRARRSHDLVAVEECPIAAPGLITTALTARRLLPRANDQATELELFTNHDASELLLTVFAEVNEANKVNEKDSAEQLLALPGVSGVQIQRDAADGAVVAAQAGNSELSYVVAGVNYQVPHGAFFQVNRSLLERFVALVTRDLKGATAWDLYSGVGLFARRLAENFSRVETVESAAASLLGLSKNLAGTHAVAHPMTTVEFLRRNRLEREPRPDAIVLDPPRAGLGESVTQLLNAIGAPVIVYVSCDPATLARDLRALTAERYAIASVTLVDMFPQTFHIETVVRLHRI